MDVQSVSKEVTTENGLMVPYCVYEGSQAKDERMIKRLIVAIIVLSICFLLSNLAWLYVWNQFDYSSVEMDGGNGVANYIDGTGDININGKNSRKEVDSQKAGQP